MEEPSLPSDEGEGPREERLLAGASADGDGLGAENFRHLAEALPQLVWTADADGEIDYIGPQFARFCGFAEDAPDRLQWLQHIHPEDQEKTNEVWAAAVASGETYEHQLRMRGASGDYFWFAARAVPVRDGTGRIVKWYGLTTEIDRQKRAELALRDLSRQKEEFIAVLSHELRNPLASILIGYEALAAEAGDPRAKAEALRLMGVQLNHMTRLVDDLVDRSMLENGEVGMRRTVFPASDLVTRCQGEFGPQAREAGIALSCEENDEVWFEADEIRSWQCLSNVLANAIQFTPVGGRVRVEARREGDFVVIRVEDTGMGIEPEEMESLFEPFVRGSAARRLERDGMGLGLTLVRRFARLQEGEVTASSAGPDQGSVFEIRLPRGEPGRDMPEREVEASGKSQASEPARILVVEDNPKVGRSLQIFLEIEGHEVILVENGAGALETLDEECFDLVFCDLALGGGMDGPEVAERIVASGGEERPYLVALSGHASERDVKRSLEAGFDRHVAKPPELSELRECIVAAVERG